MTRNAATPGAALWTEHLERLQGSLSLLPDKPEETPENTLKALWLTAAGNPVSAVIADTLECGDLDPQQIDALQLLIERRLAGVPLAHLTGRQHFLGLELLAGPAALVPRRETELLAGAALERALTIAPGQQPLTVIDVCTGCGNVALAIASGLRQRRLAARILGADLDADAVALATRNAGLLALDDIVTFASGDLLAPFDHPEYLGRVDVLSCNPPYINQAKVDQMPAEISEHEPRLAFDGGPFGVSILMRLLDEAPRFLKPGGWLAFEVGLGQGPALTRRLQRNPHFALIETVCDAEGAVRAICAQRS